MNAQIKELIDRKALFVVNHSGGKDSQAMFLMLKGMIPKEQLLIVHADLPGADWPGVMDQIKRYADGVEVLRAVAVKTFEEMVERRGKFPMNGACQGTSDLKRGPLEREIRRWVKRTGHSGLIVNCMGMRAQESAKRAKKAAFTFNKRNSIGGREWYDWQPIHSWTEAEVRKAISEAGQELHYAYQLGMRRLSCMFCVNACAQDLTIAAQANPEAYARFCALEKKINFTLKDGKSLPQMTGITPNN